jgi:hypothetical protein
LTGTCSPQIDRAHEEDKGTLLTYHAIVSELFEEEEEKIHPGHLIEGGAKFIQN